MDPKDPMPSWEKGMLLSDLPEEAVDALLATAGPQLDLPLVMVELRLMGGALGRPAAVPDAVAGRSGAFSLGVVGPGGPGARRGRCRPSAGESWVPSRGGRPLSRRSTSSVTCPAPARSSPPTRRRIAERLVEVKRAVDPAGVFTFGHAI